MTWRKGGYGQPRVRTGIRPGRHSAWVTQRAELIRKIREELTTTKEGPS